MKIDLLWFEDCPNHEAAAQILSEVLAEFGVSDPIVRIEVPDEATGNRFTFPGSPTIHIDGVDVEPGWVPCDDCTPRCRLYMTSEGLRGVPETEWVRAAVENALA
jgi:hypothetical protein